MAKSKTLTYFYQNSGIYFHPKALMTDFVLFLKFVIPFSAILGGAFLFEKKKALAVILSIFGWCAFLWFFTGNYKIAFGFLPLLLFIFALCSYKKFDLKLCVLVLSALAAGAKVFWILLLQSYGNYYIAIILIAFFALLFKYLPKKLEKTCGIYIFVAVKNQEEKIEGFMRSIIFRILYGKEDCIKNIIITDLGSTDKTKEIVEKLEHDYKFIHLVDWKTCKNLIDAHRRFKGCAKLINIAKINFYVRIKA